MGAGRHRQHWRYLIARYGAYPVIWCLAGGGTMPLYTSWHKAEDRAALREGWAEIAECVATIDPYARPMALRRSPTVRERNTYKIGCCA